jgi:hypothetical protein
LTDDAGTPAEELARLQAERDVLAQRIVQLEDRAGRRRRMRKVLTAFLVVVVSITFTASAVAVWARRNFLNNTVFAERVAPLGEDPAVKAAVTAKLSAEIVKLIDLKALIASALPERAQILAGPLSGAVNDFIRDQVRSFVDSREFDRLWVILTREAHEGAVDLLRGKTTDVASAAGGKVTLNLVPMINRLLASIGQQSPEIFGRTVNLPTITVDEVPKAAISKVESAFGIDLSDGYGQVTVFESDELSTAQDAIALFDKLTILLVVATVVLLPLTLWVSPHRRRTLLQLVVGIALGMVLIRRFSYRLEGDLLSQIRVDETRAGAESTLDVFVEPLRTACEWILIGLGVLTAAALVTGPYAWAVSLRRKVAEGARGAGGLIVQGAGSARDARVAAWLRAHRDELRIGEVLLAFLALLVLNLSWLALLLVALAIGGLELFFARTREVQGPL